MSTEPTDGLSAALFGKARRHVLALLFSHPDESFYLRQVVRAAGVGMGAVQRELKRLAQSGIVTQKRQGPHVHYQANRRCPIFIDLHKLVIKTSGVADILRQAL